MKVKITRSLVRETLFVLGLGLLVTGIGMIYLPAAFIALGACLMVPTLRAVRRREPR